MKWSITLPDSAPKVGTEMYKGGSRDTYRMLLANTVSIDEISPAHAASVQVEVSGITVGNISQEDVQLWMEH